MLKQFMKRFPEYSETSTELVRMALSEALLEVDKGSWGSKAKAGIFYLAAHKLACSPFGESVKLEGQAEDTIYLREYQRMLRTLGFGMQVV